MVQRVISQLDITVEERNILGMDGHQKDLVAARGRQTVPVLRIDQADGETVWLPESRDIIRYLQDNYAS
jgi:glutathione S-transferase